MSGLTYAKAGVPHLKGDAGYNRQIADLIGSTRIPGVMGSRTGFSALFDFKRHGYRDPLLVSSTDGVGTKLEIASLQNKHDTVGIDLVAMCVNDMITCGAKPLIFLDYYAAGKFQPKVVREVLKGITAGCRDAGCALVGGETAIMPGFYTAHTKTNSGQYDIAGFSVGMVERKKLIDGTKIKKGHVLLGIESSGFHSNGFSLLRKVFTKKQLQGKVGRSLLRPTLIYVKPVFDVLKQTALSGIVNITGGGFYDNLPRVIPKGLGAVISRNAWPKPDLFQFVQDSGNISDFEMMRTFNMGIGMVLILNRSSVTQAQQTLKKHRLSSWVIGEISSKPGVFIKS
ncbi:MAG: phosphoribosylformylglycinamidine cyclo-ligase [Candidatus Omnitrophica bacterium]|nr:phosphoribosylformylglycinamidine cyclo-ligase [Candidatus Omnitrophota bacterium]